MRGWIVMGMLLAACSSAAPLPTESVSAVASVGLPVSYAGSCDLVGPAIGCDVTFYRDYDFGGIQSFTNVTTWTMSNPQELTKSEVAFKFKARYRYPWGVSAWSQTVRWLSVGGVAIPQAPSGSIVFGAPLVSALHYTFLP